MKKDGFPLTARTEMVRWLQRKDSQGRRNVARHIMDVYFRPLQIYFLGSSFRWLGPAEEIVEAFFASRLGRDSFLEGWQRRGARFRYWILCTFKEFLFEELRRRKRERRIGSIPDEFDSPGSPGAEKEIDREFAKSVVQQAYRTAHENCRAQGLGKHWEVLQERYFEGKSYAEIAAGFSVNEVQARGMARTARDRFRRSLLDLLAQDGVAAKDQDREIRSLIEALSDEAQG